MLWRANTRLLGLRCIGAESCWRFLATFICINLRLATCEYQGEPLEPNDAQDATSSHEQERSVNKITDM